MTIYDITSFSGPYRFLSNFEYSDVTLDGVTYPTVEHAYQAAKTPPDKRECWLETDDPGRAKRMEQKVPLPTDWEERKESVMLDLLRQKFAKGTRNAQRLLSTGNLKIIEGNTWNDTYWGVCRGRGKNRLGFLLMGIREELRA